MNSIALSSNYSSNTKGKLAAVTYALPGAKYGSNILPSFAEWYSYTQAGGLAAKRLQVQQPAANNGSLVYSRLLNFDSGYTYNNEGSIASVAYPGISVGNGTPVPGPAYSYQFDSLYRPSGLADQNNNTIVNGVTYNAANQLTVINYYEPLVGGSGSNPTFSWVYETRQYNSLNQLTSLTMNGLSRTYAYTAGVNNGKIGSMNDGVQVSYQYDSLSRLSQATVADNSWGQSFGYDGFGNLVAKNVTVGSAPTLSATVDPTTNRESGASYDGNGNMTGVSGQIYTYDAENRMATAASNSGTVDYAYDP